MMESSRKIEERAAAWLSRRLSGEWSPSEEAAFNTWLEQSTAHVVAFVRLEAAWEEAQRLKALAAGVQAGVVPSPGNWRLTPFFRRAGPAADSTNVQSGVPAARPGSTPLGNDAGGALRPRTQAPAPAATRVGLRGWALAASVLLALLVSAYFYAPSRSTYRTPVGGIAVVPMSDGTKVTLNTDSRIRVAVTETERVVELKHGEAYFDVAKDPARPFVVQAGDKRVIAVGTKFSVRRDGDDMRVFVTEGRVRIEDRAGPLLRAAQQERLPTSLLTVSAGSIARASEGGVLVQEQKLPEVESYLSWRTGHLIFRDTPLADAVAEFNRYNERKILIDDPAVAGIRVSGKFRSTQYEAFVRLMQQGFPIRAQSAGEDIVLTGSAATTHLSTVAR